MALPDNKYLRASVNQCREVVYDARGVESDPGCRPGPAAASAANRCLNRDPRVCPETAQQAAREIMDYVEGTDRDGFLASDLLQRAVERQLTTLGAGLEESSPELAERIPGLAESVRRGNLLVHECDRTDSTEVWQVALRTLPEQRRVVLSVLSELNREEAASELRGHGP